MVSGPLNNRVQDVEVVDRYKTSHHEIERCTLQTQLKGPKELLGPSGHKFQERGTHNTHECERDQFYDKNRFCAKDTEKTDPLV